MLDRNKKRREEVKRESVVMGERDKCALQGDVSQPREGEKQEGGWVQPWDGQ